MNKKTGFVLIMIILLVVCYTAQAQDSLKYIRNSMSPLPEQLYDEVLVEALLLQIKADSLSRIARDLRIQARETRDDSTRKEYNSGMVLAEKEAKVTQRMADKQFVLANSLKPPTVKQEPIMRSSIQEPGVNSPVQLSREINGIKVYQFTEDYSKTEEVQNKPEEPASREENMENPGRVLPIAEPPITATENKVATNPLKTDDFAIIDKSLYSDANPIRHGLGTTVGLTYRIQLGVFSKVRPNDAFGGITPVVYEPVAGGTMFKYYAGLFYKMNSVTAALEKVRSAGFPDAFMVAFFDGKPIATEKAREIEFSEFKMNSN